MNIRGAPQGSAADPILFSTFIRDSTNRRKFFTDGCILPIIVKGCLRTCCSLLTIDRRKHLKM
jgi:hypothetical protein